MTPPLVFFAPGIPKGQPRPRAFRRGAHAGVYDPGTAEAWKFSVREAAKEQMDNAAFEGPISARLVFTMPRPKAHLRANGQLKPTAPRYHTGKPDCDNLAKAVLDALTTLGVWADDSQVAAVKVSKVYGERPGCSVIVSQLEETSLEDEE